jgi:hypothetical protein
VIAVKIKEERLQSGVPVIVTARLQTGLTGFVLCVGTVAGAIHHDDLIQGEIDHFSFIVGKSPCIHIIGRFCHLTPSLFQSVQGNWQLAMPVKIFTGHLAGYDCRSKVLPVLRWLRRDR